jgi:hypothetical protein
VIDYSSLDELQGLLGAAALSHAALRNFLTGQSRASYNSTVLLGGPAGNHLGPSHRCRWQLIVTAALTLVTAPSGAPMARFPPRSEASTSLPDGSAVSPGETRSAMTLATMFKAEAIKVLLISRAWLALAVQGHRARCVLRDLRDHGGGVRGGDRRARRRTVKRTN